MVAILEMLDKVTRQFLKKIIQGAKKNIRMEELKEIRSD
jgi:hypothetical protein